MSILSKVANFVGGDVFGAAKELALKYFPSDMTPEQRAEFEFKYADLARQKSLEAGTLANAQLEIELGDVKDARQAHSMSVMPAVVTVMLTAMVCALLYAIIFVEIQPGSRELALTLFGTVFALWGASITYWVGTTRSSGEKSNVIAQLQPKDTPK
jgi:hypothetical protein